MRLLVIINSSMFDAVLPLLKELNKMVELYCLFEANLKSTNLMPVSEKDLHSVGSAVPASDIEGMKKYREYYPIERSRVLHVTIPKDVRGFIKSIKGECNEIVSVKPDFVYFYNTPDFAYKFIYKTSIPWATAVHDPKQHSSERFQWKNELLRKIVFRKSYGFFLFSKSLIDDFSKGYKIPVQKIHSSRLAPYFQLADQDNTFETNNNKGFITVLFFGRIEPYKGVKYLLKGYKSYLESGGGGIRLVIAGRGAIEEDILDKDKTTGLIVHNRFIPDEELRKLIQSCDLVICPYTDATQSGVIMSSFAFAKPVIATNVGGLAEAIENGITGMLIKPSDYEEIKNVFLYIEKNSEQLSQWSSNIIKKYQREPYSWNSIASSLLSDIESIIKTNNEV